LEQKIDRKSSNKEAKQRSTEMQLLFETSMQHTDRMTMFNASTDRQTDRQTERETNRQSDRQTEDTVRDGVH